MKTEHNPMSPCRRSRGFTFIEVAVTMFVATSLMALAAPSFTKYTASQRVRNASYDLVAAMQLARSEAIKRNASVDVVRIGAAWTSGWRVAAGGTVLRQQDAYAQLNITDTANL